VKDTLENYLHDQVCKGKLSTAIAQQEISTDWLKYYLEWQANASSTSFKSSASPTPTSDMAYYTSSYRSAKYYYPASCVGWHGLSAVYLVTYSSLQALLAEYPDRTLSPQC
jgi:hypothetical protein